MMMIIKFLYTGLEPSWNLILTLSVIVFHLKVTFLILNLMALKKSSPLINLSWTKFSFMDQPFSVISSKLLMNSVQKKILYKKIRSIYYYFHQSVSYILNIKSLTILIYIRYTVLLFFTDGTISDFERTNEFIIKI